MMMSFNSRQSREGGSLITFLVIGVVLAALVVGGIYTASRQDGSPKTTPIATKKPSASPSKSVAVNSPQAAPSKSLKAPSPKPVSTVPPVPSTRNTPKTAPLPATGPTEDMISISMLGLLVGTMIAYIRSVRERQLAQLVD